MASPLGYGDLAKTFANRNLVIAQSQDWTGWLLASAHQGMARACAVVGDEAGRDRHIADAERALEHEDDPDNAQVVVDQLRTIPGRADS